MGVEPLAKELGERVGLLDGLGARQRGDDPACPPSGASAPPRPERAVPGELLVPARAHPLAAGRRSGRRAQVREREAALVAEPALVDLGMVPREDPLDLALARRRVDVAADRAEAADGRDVLDLPGPRLEAVLRRGQRADGAELDDVAGERRPVRLVLERGDDDCAPRFARDELAVLGDALREARAAVAEDAALAVERDRRRDRDRLLERALRERPCGLHRGP